MISNSMGASVFWTKQADRSFSTALGCRGTRLAKRSSSLEAYRIGGVGGRGRRHGRAGRLWDGAGRCAARRDAGRVRGWGRGERGRVVGHRAAAGPAERAAEALQPRAPALVQAPRHLLLLAPPAGRFRLAPKHLGQRLHLQRRLRLLLLVALSAAHEYSDPNLNSFLENLPHFSRALSVDVKLPFLGTWSRLAKLSSAEVDSCCLYVDVIRCVDAVTIST